MAGRRVRRGFLPGEDIQAEAAPPASLEMSFSEAADAPGTAADVAMGYRIFLGRDPESDAVVAEAANSPVGVFLRALMLSEEFREVVADRLHGGRASHLALPHEDASPGPNANQLGWLFSLIRVPPLAEAALRAPSNWAAWFHTLMAVPGCPMPPPRPAHEATPAQPAADAAIPEAADTLVTIDFPKPGARIHRGGTLKGGGWTVSPADVEAVTIHLGTTLLTHARYGLERPDIARRFPRDRHVDHCGFEFTAEIPDHQPEGPCELAVSVHTADGGAARQAVRLTLSSKPDPSEEDDPDATLSWPIRLVVEDAVIDVARVLWMRGWAVTEAALAGITASLGGMDLGTARHGAPRADIAGLHPDYPNAMEAGWGLVRQLDADLPEGPAVVRVQAADAEGQVRHAIVPVHLPPRHVTAQADGGVTGACETASLAADGTLRLEGWASAPEGLAALHVELDGIWLGDATLEALPPPSAAATRAGIVKVAFSFIQFAGVPPEGAARTVTLHLSGNLGASLTLKVQVAQDQDAVIAEAPFPDAAASGLRLEVDFPARQDGRAREPVRGALTISGWTIAHHGVAKVSVFFDDGLLGQAYLGMRREDIGAAFPDHEGALLAGFALVLPPGALPPGRHVIQVVALAALAPDAPAGPPAELQESFEITVQQYDALPPDGDLRTVLPPAEAAFGLRLLERKALERNARQPRFDIVLQAAPGAAPDPAALEVSLRSLLGQAYPHWTVLVSASGTAALKAARAIAGHPDAAGRILVDKPSRPAKGATPRRSPAEDAASEPVFGMLLRPGDRLGADALLELAVEIAAAPEADFIYADELRPDPAQARTQPFFKPDWSPELLQAMNYIGRAWCASAALLDRAGLSRAEAVSDYAAVLRLTEQAARIGHVARVLWHRGASADGRAEEQAALQAALERRGVAAKVEPCQTDGTWRIRRQIPVQAAGKRRPVAGRVSIIIPTCAARDLVRTAIKTIRSTTAPGFAGGRDVEIVILDNIPPGQAKSKAWLKRHADLVIDMPGPFNWSRFNNTGARAATGEYLLFLNDDMEAREPGWLEAMLEHAQRPDVGVVGARLLYPGGQVQHAGQYLSSNHARHAFRFADGDNPGPFGLAGVAREMISVTGACQMVRASTFAQLGGFDEAHDVVNNDLDFCLRSWRDGLSVIYTPHATLVHHELASRATLDDSYDMQRFTGAWRTRFVAGDPFRNPHLRAEGDHYGWEREPAMLLHAGRRGPQADAVRRILAVKLDHIGDFLTALPALRSLRRRFPNASIDLLAPAPTAELARHEATISQTIVFDFFHARSGDGKREIGDDDLAALAARLEPARYDIAIDLRMHPDTRMVLPHTGAAFLAGYDHDNRFPFLDVALEWEGDDRQIFKRAHISERLLQLVSALEDACRDDAAGAPAGRVAAASIPALAGLPAPFLARPLVCVHPGVGNPIRQWPAGHYAGLIDLLAEAGYHAVLVGAPEEMTLAQDILGQLQSAGAAVSLVGRVKLADLADVMRACVLFVGNNSGPQHLAASLGMPAIGIHSGVVDATEWAPLGPQAVAIRRRMVCGPCYLEFPSDCPRSLACLTGLRPRDVFAIARRLLP